MSYFFNQLRLRSRQNRSMPSQENKPRPLARMWPPSPRWSEQVAMFLVRDTRGCRLEDDEDLNRFPANPYCCITWMLEGQVQIVGHAKFERDHLLPSVFIHGCQTRPCVSRNLGERHSFCVVFHPDAFHALFGLDLQALQDGFADARHMLPLETQPLIDAVSNAPRDRERAAIIEAFLAAHSKPHASSPWLRMRRLGMNISLHVAGRVLGVGPRQAQRLAQRDGGLRIPALSKLWRGERSLQQARGSLALAESIDWASHAAEAGYADQAHLVRDCKEICGRTPIQMVRQSLHDEADWVYRL